MKLIECVPNFSEGKDKNIIKAITDEIRKVEGATLLDVDPGADTNRTVVTFVAGPDALIEAAFNAIKKASELINMEDHKGAHPRMGATDVCPLIPISGISEEECIEVSKTLAEKVGSEIGIPVYLYEKSASKPEWKQMANIREGEYEALERKFKDENWKPDYGPFKFNPKSGATVIGVRDFLIAYNINLNTQNKKIAKDIGLSIRDSGRLKKDVNGKIVKDENGKKMRVPGTLQACKATGWFLQDFNIAQVTMNLIDYKTTGIHTAYEEVRRQAEIRGVLVTGSEIVGLIPMKAIVDAGKFYLSKQGMTQGITESEIIDMGIMSLGLSSLYKFEPEKKIIEYKVGARKRGDLVRKKVFDFVDEIAADSVAPGGGSVAALLNSMAAALCTMVANVTYSLKNFSHIKADMEEVAVEGQKIKDRLLSLIDEDTEAFNDIISARRKAKKTDKEKVIRKEAMENATKKAAEIPLETCKLGLDSLKLINENVEKINPNSITDIAVGALSALAGVEGAYLNVIINLQDIEDKNFNVNITKKADSYLEEAKKLKESIMERTYLIMKGE